MLGRGEKDLKERVKILWKNIKKVVAKEQDILTSVDKVVCSKPLSWAVRTIFCNYQSLPCQHCISGAPPDPAQQTPCRQSRLRTTEGPVAHLLASIPTDGLLHFRLQNNNFKTSKKCALLDSI